MKTALSIAGSDCSGGAGIQADLKTFGANGVYGMSVITSIVAENTSRVISSWDISPKMIAEQITAVFEDIDVHSVKIGMLSSAKIMEVVGDSLIKYNAQNIVVDPVMLSKDGSTLMQSNATKVFKKKIMPLSFLITPNIPEAEVITNIEIKKLDDIKKACKIIYELGAKNVLIKGGHFENNTNEVADILFDGKDFSTYASKRVDTKNTHGTGCTLSSAISANLAKGSDVYNAVSQAKDYITNAIIHSLSIGKGNGPLNHFYKLI